MEPKVFTACTVHKGFIVFRHFQQKPGESEKETKSRANREMVQEFGLPPTGREVAIFVREPGTLIEHRHN